MKNPFNFEPEPLKGHADCGCHHEELDMDMEEFESEEEVRGGRRFPTPSARLRSRPLRRPLRPLKRPLLPPPTRLKRPWLRPPRPPYRGPWVSWPIVGVPGVYREPDGFEPEPTADSEYVRWVQSCLNRILGLQLPVTGRMGPETRSAVRSFQGRQGLRTSGIVSPDTETALRTACAGQQQADGRGASEPDGIQNLEMFSQGILLDPEDEFSNEEIKIESPYTVQLTSGGPVRIPSEASLEHLPKEQGIYFIRIRESLWYIGKAANIRKRFQDRFRVFDEFKIPRDAYSPWTQPITVGWYILKILGPPVARGIKSWAGKKGWQPHTRKAEAMRLAVEQYFIHKVKPPGNKATECVRFEGKGAINLVFSKERRETMNAPVFCEKSKST